MVSRVRVARLSSPSAKHQRIHFAKSHTSIKVRDFILPVIAYTHVKLVRIQSSEGFCWSARKEAEGVTLSYVEVD